MANLTGTSNNDILTSTSADENIDGGLGKDTVKFSGQSSDYSIQGSANGSWTVADQNTTDGDNGIDIISNVEVLEFSDKNHYITSDYVAKGAEFPVNTYTSGSQYSPSTTALNDGGFVITWYSNNQDGSSYGIYAQRYNADGSVNGAEFPVNTYTSSSQSSPSTTALNDGGFVITWQSDNQDGSGSGIYAQQYQYNSGLVITDGNENRIRLWQL